MQSRILLGNARLDCVHSVSNWAGFLGAEKRCMCRVQGRHVCGGGEFNRVYTVFSWKIFGGRAIQTL
jgi:hypothetical protein